MYRTVAEEIYHVSVTTRQKPIGTSSPCEAFPRSPSPFEQGIGRSRYKPDRDPKRTSGENNVKEEPIEQGLLLSGAHNALLVDVGVWRRHDLETIHRWLRW
jgi:hypothetical protein